RKGDAALALALASGQTVRDAALAAGIGERTATRRVADPDFRRRVAELRADMVQRTLDKMACARVQAVETLRELLTAPSSTVTVKLGAARALLEMGAKFWKSVELEQRIAALEHAGEISNKPVDPV